MSNLATIQLRWAGLLFVAVIVRFGTEALLNAGVDIVDTLRLPLLAARASACCSSASGSTAATRAWASPSSASSSTRSSSSSTAATCRSGTTALDAAGMSLTDVTSALHVVVAGTADRLPVQCPDPRRHHPDPHPVRPERRLDRRRVPVARSRLLPVRERRPRPDALERAKRRRIRERLVGIARLDAAATAGRAPAVAPETGLAPALQEIAALERPLFMGAPTAGLASPALAPLPPDRRARRRAHRRGDEQRCLRPRRHRRRRDGRCAEHHPPASLPGDAGTGPPTPVCPARPQRLVHGAVGRPAHLAVRRPDPPGRPGGGRLRADRLACWPRRSSSSRR